MMNKEEKQELFDSVMDQLWDKFEDGYQLENLNEVERPLIVSQIIQDSINIGGINSYFFNKANQYNAIGLDAFQKIGLTEVAKILNEAITIFPVQPIPDDLEECRVIMENLPDENPIDKRWHELSSAFYDLSESIFEITVDYMQKNFK